MISIPLQILATGNSSNVDTDQESRRESGVIRIPHLIVETRTQPRSRSGVILNHVPTMSISDVSSPMPDMSGPSAAERINARAPTCTLIDMHSATHPGGGPELTHARETTGTRSDRNSTTHPGSEPELVHARAHICTLSDLDNDTHPGGEPE